MTYDVTIVGAGLAGSQAALTLVQRGYTVRLYEMRPVVQTAVHHTGMFAELVCSNSLKSTDECSAAGMLKHELKVLGSQVYAIAESCAVPAGGALAVDRQAFAQGVTSAVCAFPQVTVCREECPSLAVAMEDTRVVVLASGPLTSDALADSLVQATGTQQLHFYDAAAPLVMADSLDHTRLFSQSRYEQGTGDYLNAPFSRAEYDLFIDELVRANRTILHDFETKDLFQACQPIEEIARKGHDAPRFGPLKPVGLIDPRTGHRPWAALQLRAENAEKTCYNLVGFQTNLTFPEQRRVFSMIPGLEHAEFARYGVMHRNTFLNAPQLLDNQLRLRIASPVPVYVAGQLSGTEGYVEAIRSGLHAGLSVAAYLSGISAPALPDETAFGALLAYATNPQTRNYQPSHVTFGLLPALAAPVRNKAERYAAYARRGSQALGVYVTELQECGLL